MSGALHRVQIIADFNRPAADAPVGVRFFKMTACVIDHIPIYTVFFDVIGQQSLREISVLEFLIVGQLHDFRTRLVVDLSRHGRQRVVAARGHVGLLP